MNEHIIDTENQERPMMDFPIIGIGASAGGLEAVTTMVHDIEAGMGIAYVLVLHLDPNHESLMAELLSRKTHIDVRQIEDGDLIEVDCLHVIPPGYSLSIKDSRFSLERFSEPRGLRRPIDSFFTSLAETQRDKAACVVLSGTGADGSAGLRVVKEFGGVCAVQSPEEARYDGMPFSALSTNLVDFTLPADEIIPRLKLFFDGAFRPDFSENAEAVLLEIFETLRTTFGHDFSGYKRATLMRRLDRRMQVLEYTKAELYLEKLKGSEEEQAALLQDFLINVTAFFRDREQFEALRQLVILPMIKASDSSDELRIWVPGCSSGQEAYTIAMMVDEACEDLKRRPLVQIFATDLDETMIAQARRGVYPVSVFTELPKKYQDTYTMGLDGKFEMVKRIRDMVRFSVHNLIQDPPFSKIDLISCRNLLIYLGEELQTDVLPLIHFSLRPGGHLFLGTSENVTRHGELFSAVDQKARIFRRQNTAKRIHINLPLGGSSGSDAGARANAKMAMELDFPRHRSLDVTNATIYEQYSPPFLRIATDGRIIDSSGDLSLFLASRPGDERNLQSLARDSVRDVVMPLVSDAAAEDRRRAIKDVDVHSPFGVQRTDIIAHPLKDDTVAVIFLVKDRLAPVVDEYAVDPHTRDRRIADLQEDLQATRLLLKSKVEEIETANEELKSSNEEMMSMNEELQSANEELTTANEELKNKIDELTLANADLDNFVQSSDLAMIVLDRAIRIRHVTEAARKIVPVVRSDKGRLLSEFNLNLNNFDLLRSISSVLSTGNAIAATTEADSQGRAFFVRVMPYYFGDGSIEGVTVTMVDITEETKLRQSLNLESQRRELAMRAGRMGLAEFDINSGKIDIDEVLAEQFGMGHERQVDFQTLTKYLPSTDVKRLDDAIKHALSSNVEYEVDFTVAPPEAPQRWIRTRGIPYVAPDGRRKIVGPTLDITDENAIERQELLLREMSHRVKNIFAVLSAIIHLVPKEEDETQKFAKDLINRIVALGEAYDLARKNRVMFGVHLRNLLETIISPHLTGQKLTLDGPDVLVKNSALNTLTLIMHEMTTNAIKHGALSAPSGHIDIQWSLEGEGKIGLSWAESGIEMSGEDLKKGFGSRLIEMGVRQLQGQFTQDLSGTGLVSKFQLNVVPEDRG